MSSNAESPRRCRGKDRTPGWNCCDITKGLRSKGRALSQATVEFIHIIIIIVNLHEMEALTHEFHSQGIFFCHEYVFNLRATQAGGRG